MMSRLRRRAGDNLRLSLSSCDKTASSEINNTEIVNGRIDESSLQWDLVWSKDFSDLQLSSRQIVSQAQNVQRLEYFVALALSSVPSV